ncbi:PREDICTED: uncharacterized protein LOC104732071 [Camelina sativa]|uniref:S-protein homolog n=1 Tax=Camelina sativa TaxID=90675 RepID=A0ABM0V2P3_CAMSA|nr:PREDICTED: uncharacterized protein LOC104732071 [Camelina sativa]
MNRLMICMFVLAMCFGLNVSSWFKCPNNKILIENDLGPGLVLQYHCHSRDDNLTVANLQFKEMKRIVFGDKLGRRTRWTCTLKHGLYMRYSKEFIAYKAGVIDDCDKWRHWIAKRDGIYLIKDKKLPAVFKHAWIKKTK